MDVILADLGFLVFIIVASILVLHYHRRLRLAFKRFGMLSILVVGALIRDVRRELWDAVKAIGLALLALLCIVLVVPWSLARSISVAWSPRFRLRITENTRWRRQPIVPDEVIPPNDVDEDPEVR